MIPILYEKTESDFTHNGVGFLRDTVKCTVTEERNGFYECSLQYPITGQWYDQITDGCIIKAKANETSEPQLFRIYKSSKPLKGIVTYSAEHISYDLNGIPTLGFSVKNTTPQAAITRAIDEAGLPCSFTAISDISTLNSTTILTPCSVRAILGGQTGSVLDVWGGEYEFDNFVVKLHKYRGADNGVTIEYGKNLKDLKQESNIAECYTHLMPYATYSEEDENGDSIEVYVYLSEKVLPLAVAENIGHYKAYIMDFTDRFGDGEEITEEKLRAKATAYAVAEKLGVPKVNITVSFVQLWQTEEYKNIAPLERVMMCDTVTVRFSQLGVTASAKVIKTVYNTLEEKYDSVELGDAKSSFADTVNKQQSSIEEIKTTVKKGQAQATEQLKKAIANATSLITGHSGGYVVLNPAEMPQEILILDAPTIEEAVNVWRWNSGGLGHSSTGYNGNYALAMTMDGNIVADFIKSGEINGNLIKADTIQANAISAETFRIIFNNVSDYIMFEDGQLKIIDTSDRESVILGKNGLEIFNGDITVYSGADKASRKAIYLDSDGNIAYTGYITQAGSNTKAIVGNNAYNNPGFFVYQLKDAYKKSDGTYKPYIEFWNSTENNSFITGVNKLFFNIDDMSGNSFTSISCSTSGGTLYGDWNFNKDQFFTCNIGSSFGFVLQADGTRYGSFYLSSNKTPCFNSDSGNNLNFNVSGNTKLACTSSGGTLYGIWGAEKINVRSYTKFRVDATDVGYIDWDSTGYLLFNMCGYGWGVTVNNSYRISANSSGGNLYGTWYGTSSQAIPSDTNKKHSIEEIPDIYSDFFDLLSPKRYKYNDGTSDRFHTGFIAQEIEQALTSAEISTSDFAGFIKDDKNEYYLRYEEFIALCVNEIQKLKNQNIDLIKKVNGLETALKITEG